MIPFPCAFLLQSLTSKFLPPPRLKLQFRTATITCIHILLAKASHVAKLKVSEASNHALPVPVLSKASWQRQEESEDWEQKFNLP